MIGPIAHPDRPLVSILLPVLLFHIKTMTRNQFKGSAEPKRSGYLASAIYFGEKLFNYFSSLKSVPRPVWHFAAVCQPTVSVAHLAATRIRVQYAMLRP